MKTLKSVLVLLFVALFSVSVFGTAVNLTTGTNAVRTAHTPTPVVLVKVLDFATAGAVTGDVVSVIAIPAGTKVNEVYYKVATTNDASSTINIGDATTADKWVSALNVGTATAGAVNSASNAFYTATDYIKVTLTGATPTKGTVIIKVDAVLYGEAVAGTGYVSPYTN